MIELKPETPIQYLKGVGPRVGALFQKLNVHTVEAFCFFFPRSYEDRRKLPLISQVQAGEQVCLYGTIKSISEKKVSKNTLIHCILEDRSGSIVLTWFNQPFLLKQLKRFSQLVVKGKAVYNSFEGSIQLHVTEFEGYVNPEQSRQAIGSIIPIYPLTKGLSQFHCRSVARQIFHLSSVQLKELYPPHLRDYLNLIPLNAAVRHLHFPSQTQLFEQARYRIVFDEFFTYQLRLAQRGYTLSEEISAEPLDISGPLIDSYLKSLPYALTQAQKQAIEEIKKDISSRTCMNRLLQGDVGSGKTDVAIMGLLFAIQSGKVAAVMVPTEVLAQQHYLKLSSRLGHLGVQVLLLKGKMKVKKKREAMAMLEQDKNLIIVGTHALIQEAVKVKNLGMIIVDEQHRFGVIQRAMFKQKGLRPHALFMTATPIPRTFMLTSFGDLKKSIINEMPPGRVPQIGRAHV